MKSGADQGKRLAQDEKIFFILLSLAGGARHGFSLLKDVERLSGGRLTLSTGALYGAIHQLLQRGWIRRCESGAGQIGWEEEAREAARPHYHLTRRGRQMLEASPALQGSAEATRQGAAAGGRA